jgi:hypothetical protein
MAIAAPAHVYVYYRVAADNAAARDAIAALLAAVETATGAAGRLLARCDDPAMWMEIYEPVADPAIFALQLAELARRHRVTAITIDGHRHAECFAPLPPIPAVVAGGRRASADRYRGS